MCLCSCKILNDIYACANNVLNRINPDKRAPIGAYSSGYTLCAIKMMALYVLIFMYILTTYARTNNIRNRINPDERAPIGAYSSGITLFAIKIQALHVYILTTYMLLQTMFVTE